MESLSCTLILLMRVLEVGMMGGCVGEIRLSGRECDQVVSKDGGLERCSSHLVSERWGGGAV